MASRNLSGLARRVSASAPSGILPRMRSALLLPALTLVACSMGPTNPIPTTPSKTVGPATTIALNVVPAVGADAGKASLAATVKDDAGQGIGYTTVIFLTSAGTIDPVRVTTDAMGLAQAQLAAAPGQAVTVTAVSGSATASKSLLMTGGGALTVTLSADPVAFGAPSILKANVVGATYPIFSGWNFGDGQTTSNSAYAVQHTYGTTGSYTASVSVIDALGHIASASTSVVVTPAALTVKIACTSTAAPGVTIPCNVTATDATGAVVTGQLSSTTFDWGDGTMTTVAGQHGSHAYLAVGTYIIAATAHVGATQSGAATTSVTVQ